MCDDCVPQFPFLPQPALLALPGACVALARHEGLARRIVIDLKYGNRRGAAPWLAERLASRIDETAWDVVAWVPGSHAGGRARGYEPSAVLARSLARELRLPARRALVRVDRRGQTNRARFERAAGPSLRPAPGVDGARVLVVDDVRTSGASLRAAERCLLAAGALPGSAVATSAG